MIIDSQAYLGESLYLKRKFTVEELLKKMDSNGIDMSIVTATSPAIGQNYVEANEIVHKAVDKNPGKLFGFYRINPWFKEDELERAEKAIREWGFKGFKLNPFHDSYGLIGYNLKGKADIFEINELLKPVLDLATELKIPVFIHTGDSSFCPEDAIPIIAASYPELTLMTRLNAAIKCVDKGLENIVFGTFPLGGGHKGIDSGLKFMAETTSDKIVFTTETPFGYPEFELKVIELTEISPEARKRIMSENVKRILKI